MDISIVIPSYNAQESLPDLLLSLERQVGDIDYEIVVVDCSDTSEVEDLCKSFPHVKCIRRRERFNPGIGRNLGAREARGRLLVFVDADLTLEENALKEAWTFHGEGHEIFGGALELSPETRDLPAMIEHLFFNHESHVSRPPSRRRNLSSALMLVQADLFEKNGGFLDIPRMQDTEFTERLRTAGKTLYFAPQVVGYQRQDSTLSAVFRKIYINGRNLYFIRYDRKRRTFKVLLFLALPLVTTSKVARIIARHLRYQTQQLRLVTLFVSPFLMAAGATWMFGLYRSLLGGGGISARRS